MTVECLSHPPGLAVKALQATVPIVEHVQLARDTWRIRLAAPEIARVSTPGQFYMLRAPGRSDPLLGRPFALYDTYLDESGDVAGLDVVYLVVGKMTRVLAQLQAGDQLELWGPLGNGFPVADCEHLILVAGGIGQTPFLATAREALGLRQYAQRTARKIPKVTLCYGARSAEYLAGLEDFSNVGLNLKIATDDGSRGHKGFVTDLLLDEIRSSSSKPHVFCCGPEPMMHAVSKLVRQHQVPTWLSMETPMACGFGACFSCVTKIREAEGEEWDYKRVCVEGPIFPADKVVFD